MFDFRIINTPDGNQIIDPSLKTPYESLSLVKMIEYIEMDKQIAIMDSIRKKKQREADRRRKLARNPLYRLACLCGMV